MTSNVSPYSNISPAPQRIYFLNKWNSTVLNGKAAHFFIIVSHRCQASVRLEIENVALLCFLFPSQYILSRFRLRTFSCIFFVFLGSKKILIRVPNIWADNRGSRFIFQELSYKDPYPRCNDKSCSWSSQYLPLSKTFLCLAYLSPVGV